MSWRDKVSVIGRRGKRYKRAAVLGCGPSGMFAIHALLQLGWTVRVFSKRRPSYMFGAQYLHNPIPGLEQIETEIDYRLEGTAEGYGDKVYGPGWQGNHTVSPQELVGRSSAWDIRAAYFSAYDLYYGLISDVSISSEWIRNELLDTERCGKWDLIFSTVPAPLLCQKPGEHQFLSAKIWASGDAPQLDRWCPIKTEPDTVICSGDPAHSWYRRSNVFGHNTCEWPEGRKPPYEGVAEVVKPLSTDCDCFPIIYRSGRYGAWQKGYLADWSYRDARRIGALAI